MSDIYLMHHGTKGQKWGVRRYQNPDGSLTPEGKRRYAMNTANVGGMSNNTKDRMNKGAKIGASVGAGVGLGVTSLTAGQLAATAAAAGGVLNPAAVVAMGAILVGSYAASGALRGALAGGIYGAVETKQARKYMNDTDITNTSLSKLKETSPKNTNTKDIYKNTYDNNPDYKRAMDTYNNYSSGKKVSAEKRYEASQKLFEMGDDLRDTYNNPKIDNDVYRRAEELAPSKKEWESRKK